MQTSFETSPFKNSTPQSKLLTLTREFNVPVDQLFAAFSTADAIKAWWWPKDLYADHVEYDFHEDGSYFINMKGFDKGGGGMTGEFNVIVDNERIVMSDYFADEKGNPITATQANMPGSWPAVIYITFEFEEVDEHRSRLLLAQQGIPNELQDDCLLGWSQSFDKLEKYLNDRKH